MSRSLDHSNVHLPSSQTSWQLPKGYAFRQQNSWVRCWGSSPRIFHRNPQKDPKRNPFARTNYVVWDASSPPKPMEKKKMPRPPPDLHRQSDWSFGKAKASKRFTWFLCCLSFLLWWQKWFQHGSRGRMRHLNAAVSNPSLLFLCSTAGLNHALHNIVSKAVLEDLRPNLLEMHGNQL